MAMRRPLVGTTERSGVYADLSPNSSGELMTRLRHQPPQVLCTVSKA